MFFSYECNYDETSMCLSRDVDVRSDINEKDIATYYVTCFNVDLVFFFQIPIYNLISFLLFGWSDHWSVTPCQPPTQASLKGSGGVA